MISIWRYKLGQTVLKVQSNIENKADMASTNRQEKNGLLHKKEKPGLPWGGKITPAPQPTQSYTTKAVKFDKDR